MEPLSKVGSAVNDIDVICWAIVKVFAGYTMLRSPDIWREGYDGGVADLYRPSYGILLVFYCVICFNIST